MAIHIRNDDPAVPADGTDAARLRLEVGEIRCAELGRLCKHLRQRDIAAQLGIDGAGDRLGCIRKAAPDRIVRRLRQRGDDIGNQADAGQEQNARQQQQPSLDAHPAIGTLQHR
ncbi:MAG: hypothetical protein E6471_04520 [Bradyrhizobium sp.]|nr:hypothetical protein [Bradyrhizobium sp.]